MKPIIAVDIDDVLLPHFQDLINWYNATFNTNVLLSDNNNSDPQPWGTATEQEAIQRVHLFFETPTFRDAEPFLLAKTVLAELSGKYNLVVVSARDSIIEQMTRDWLNRHFSNLISDAHFTAQYSLEGKMRSKGEVCKQIGAKYLIDDSLTNAYAAYECGIKVILFGSYPWNVAKTLPGGIVRCEDWIDVKEYFNAQRG